MRRPGTNADYSSEITSGRMVFNLFAKTLDAIPKNAAPQDCDGLPPVCSRTVMSGCVPSIPKNVAPQAAALNLEAAPATAVYIARLQPSGAHVGCATAYMLLLCTSTCSRLPGLVFLFSRFILCFLWMCLCYCPTRLFSLVALELVVWTQFWLHL